LIIFWVYLEYGAMLEALPRNVDPLDSGGVG
jgi:hypothetical protein